MLFVTSGELYAEQTATLKRISTFAGQPLTYRSLAAQVSAGRFDAELSVCLCGETDPCPSVLASP